MPHEEIRGEDPMTAEQLATYTETLAALRPTHATQSNYFRLGLQRLTAAVMTALIFAFAGPACAQSDAAQRELVVAALGGALGQSIKEVF